MTALLSLLRELPGPPSAVARIARALEPDALVREAARHGLSAYVARELERAGVSLSEPHAQVLHRNALGTFARSKGVQALLCRALDGLRERGITPVLLKGPALSARLYSDPLVRETSDVDLWVAPGEVESAASALVAMGLHLKEEAEDYYPPRYRHHWSYVGPAGLVELHFRAMSAYGTLVDGSEWLPRAQSFTFEGRPARVLAPEDELVFLCLHAASHLLQRIAWLFDLKLFLLAHPSLDWERLVDLARSSALPNQVYLTLEVSRRLLGGGAPREKLEPLAPSRLRQAAARWFFTAEKLSESALLHDKRAWFLAKCLLADSRPRWGRFLAARAAWSLKKALRG